jgi:hypothetical protein
VKKGGIAMANHHNRRFGCLVALVLSAIITSGCSMVGLGTGMVIDDSRSDEKTIEGWKCGSIKKGTRATVHLKDGEHIEGVFEGLSELPLDEYKTRYSRFRVAYARDLSLPEIGDTLRITDWKGDQGMHEFGGFGYRYKSLPRRSKEERSAVCQYLSAMAIDHNEQREFRLKYLDEIVIRDGNVIGAEKMEDLASQGKIPLKNVMAINNAYGNRHLVNIENIKSIEVPRKKNAKWIGLGLGLLVDGAIVAIAIAISSMPSWGGLQ